MKNNLIYKLFTNQLAKSRYFPTLSRNLSTLTSDFSKYFISYHSFTSLRLLTINNTSNKFNLRLNTRWTPNIVKSPIMNHTIPEGTVVENIWPRFDLWGDHVALVCGVTGREITFKEVKEISKKIATALLTDLQLKPGQVLALILPNTPECVFMLLGAIEAGIIVTTVNPLFTTDEISLQLEDSGAVAAVTLPNKLPDVMEAVSRLNNKDFKLILTPNIDGSMSVGQTGQVIPYSELIKKKSDQECINGIKSNANITTNDVLLMPYSSGTTGKPKGVCLTHRNMLAQNFNMRFVKNVWETTNNHQDVLPVLLPIFHTYGLSLILTECLYSGAKLILLPKFDETTFLRALKDYMATVLYAAPPLIFYLVNSPAVTEEHLSSLRTVICGAAPLAHSDIVKFINKAGGKLDFRQGYGLTETSPDVLAVPEGMKVTNYSTVGIPFPNTEIKIADLQTGQALGANEEGEIQIKGPQVMKGYLNNDAATKECIDEAGWFHSGDVGYYDENGCFFVTDRVKELIKVKGFQVAPSELEGVLRSHPDIIDAGVIGIPHEKHGETPIAFIQCKVANNIEQNLREYLKEKLAKYKHVSKYFIVDAIPKTASGKILRKDLKVLYQTITAGN